MKLKRFVINNRWNKEESRSTPELNLLKVKEKETTTTQGHVEKLKRKYDEIRNLSTSVQTVVGNHKDFWKPIYRESYRELVEKQRKKKKRIKITYRYLPTYLDKREHQYFYSNHREPYGTTHRESMRKGKNTQRGK